MTEIVKRVQGPHPTYTRANQLHQLGEHVFDVLVVGGGITGAGIARDAAMRGLRVALVDKGDWASGTSSKSSRLVHGGLRYLENMEFGLVIESVSERYHQRKLNPNLVWPLPFVFPVYKHDRHSLFKINLGLWLYDIFSLFRTWRRHRRLSASRTKKKVPGLVSASLSGSVHYYDCRTDDARLTLANVLSGQRNGATVANHVHFAHPHITDNRVIGAQLKDVLTDQVIDIQCKHIVYATGPWTDNIPEAPGKGGLLRPTKGVHIVVPHARLPLDVALVMNAVSDGRVVFAIPDQGTTFIGTTDTDYDGDLDTIRATGDDISYLLETTNLYFPEADLTPGDILSSWAGLRPLIRSEAASAYKTSREHTCYSDERGITTIAGGKLTTYRLMAQEVVDAVISDLQNHGFTDLLHPCRTKKTQLDTDLPRWKTPSRGPKDEFDHMLWRHHGSVMHWVKERMRTVKDEASPLHPELNYVRAQVTAAVLFEGAMTLEDVLMRRLKVFYHTRDLGLSIARNVAKIMANVLDRNSAWCDEQVTDYEARVTRDRKGIKALELDSREPMPALEHTSDLCTPDSPGIK